ncbi:ATP-binding protein [Streptomyces fragilis]|uniref:ATP-binding protein n=1 Tax=Streptomyces fragilis TaxID=67301 RepID=A0ABV2YFD4_9ACTN|nr:ATP-binding protein [Streptomyces fragilis]
MSSIVRRAAGAFRGEVVEVLDVRKTPRAEWTFPSSPRAVPAARSAVVGRLEAWGLDGVRDTAALLVTELITNSVRHGPGGPIDLRIFAPDAEGGPEVEGGPGTVRIEVRDEDPLPPRPREEVRPEDESGRGLLLLTSLARAWGVHPGLRGKTVWFELAVPG